MSVQKIKKVPVFTKEQNRELVLSLLQLLANERDRFSIKPSGDPLRDLLELLSGPASTQLEAPFSPCKERPPCPPKTSRLIH